MASIVIDPSERLIKLICGAGETDVSFDAPDIYAAWKDWLLIGTNSALDPAMDSEGGSPVGGGESLGRAYFVLASNDWALAPETTEDVVKITIVGDIFPSPATDPLFDYSLVASKVFIESRTSTLPSIKETGVSGLTVSESAKLNNLDATVSSRLAAASYSVPPSASAIAAAVGDPLATVVESGFDARAMLRIIAAMAAGAYTVDESGTMVFQGIDGETARITGSINPETGARTISDLDAS